MRGSDRERWSHWDARTAAIGAARASDNVGAFRIARGAAAPSVDVMAARCSRRCLWIRSTAANGGARASSNMGACRSGDGFAIPRCWRWCHLEPNTAAIPAACASGGGALAAVRAAASGGASGGASSLGDAFVTGGTSAGSLAALLAEGGWGLRGGAATLDLALPNLQRRIRTNAQPTKQKTIATLESTSARIVIVLFKSSTLAAVWWNGGEGGDGGGGGGGAGGSLTTRSCTLNMLPPLDDGGSTALSASAMAVVDENASSTALDSRSPCDTTVVLAESAVVVKPVTFTPWLTRPCLSNSPTGALAFGLLPCWYVRSTLRTAVPPSDCNWRRRRPLP